MTGTGFDDGGLVKLWCSLQTRLAFDKLEVCAFWKRRKSHCLVPSAWEVKDPTRGKCVNVDPTLSQISDVEQTDD